MKLRENRLKDKGWSDEQIDHAKGILREADKQKSSKKKLHEEILLWILLVLISSGSLIGAWIAQPVLLLLSQTQAILALSVIGIFFGLFAGWIVAELEELESHHHTFMTISIPVVSIASAILISQRVSLIIAASPAFEAVNHNPYLLALSYAIATIIPYSIILYVEKKRYETH
jgi:hypothetical protein